MAAAAASALTLFVVTFAVILNTTAADPEMLQDVCVADLSSPVQACRRARLKFNIMGAQNHSAGALSRVAATLYRSPSQVA